jgi:hypothetical protein
MTTEAQQDPIDAARLSLFQFLARVPVTQSVPAILLILSCGAYFGRLESDYSKVVELQRKEAIVAELRVQNSELSRLEKSGPFGDLPPEPWKILEKGNKLLVAGESRKAIMVYRTVEFVDRYGKDVNTSAAYDTISKLSAIEATASGTFDAQKAKWFAFDAAKYKKASEYAAQCKAGDCENSQNFWTAH